MIARLTVATPFTMIVQEGAQFTLYSYEEEGCLITARPPGKSDVPLRGDVPDNVEVDGKPAFAANAIQFDFQKENFDRKRANSQIDPPPELMQRVVSSFISRLRYVGRGFHIQPIDFSQGTTWRLQYLNDDGSELPEEAGLVRGLGGRHWTWSFVGITPSVWGQMYELDPDWKAPVWDDILLDATHALPKIGTAMVLAATSLEVFISDVLDRLSTGGDVPADVWEWIMDRDNRLKEPSTEEQFDILLKHFLGHSLKDDAKLWQSFKELRAARNSFVHEGRARTGNKDLELSDAKRLIGEATQIINLVRTWLPLEHQWPQFDTKIELRAIIPLT